MMQHLEFLIAAFVFYEAVIINIFNLIHKSNPVHVIWIVLGSKVLKLLLTVGGILIVKFLTEVPLKRFALMTIAVYFVSVAFETIFFLKRMKNEKGI